MIAEWIVGLLVTLIATPVAIASYMSARRAAEADRSQASIWAMRVEPPARVPAPGGDSHRRHYHRRLAA
jgi:hypothetical protein